MFRRYEGTAWEERFLPRLTSRQVKELPKENALVILPIGAIEQHGPHLPVMTDALIGEAILTKALEKTKKNLPIWLLPPISYGKSNEHIGFAGTISLSAETLIGIVTDIAVGLRSSGFNKLLLFNTHGGNVDLLHFVSREIYLSTGLILFNLSPGSLGNVDDLIDAEEREFGIHGGDYETSMVKSIKPNWVQEEFARSELPDLHRYRYVTLEGKIRFAWRMSDISESGICGDATKATADKGSIILERISNVLVKVLEELCSFTISDVKRKPIIN